MRLCSIEWHIHFGEQQRYRVLTRSSSLLIQWIDMPTLLSNLIAFYRSCSLYDTFKWSDRGREPVRRTEKPLIIIYDWWACSPWDRQRINDSSRAEYVAISTSSRTGCISGPELGGARESRLCYPRQIQDSATAATFTIKAPLQIADTQPATASVAVRSSQSH